MTYLGHIVTLTFTVISVEIHTEECTERPDSILDLE